MRRISARLTGPSLVITSLAVLAVAACSDGSSGADSGSAHRDGGATSDGSQGLDSGDGNGGRADGEVTADGAASEGGLRAEVCNGIDDDGNGRIDDIDRGGDGICDCLHIATLGVAGEWGEGDVFADWLESRSDFGVAHINEGGADPELTRTLLDPYEVIVVQDLRPLDPFTSEERDALAQWVQAGGGLMTLIGYGDPGERARVNTLLSPLDLRYASEQILAGSPTIPVDDRWTEHPTAMAISAVGVDNGYEVEDLNGSGTVIAEESGFTVAIAKTYGEGKVFAWGDEWITYNSEWSDTRYEVEQLWINLINWLTPESACEIDVILI